MKNISTTSGLRVLGICFAALLPLTIASATALGAWTTAAMTSIKFYAEDAGMLIAIGQTVATEFATIAAANNYWR